MNLKTLRDTSVEWRWRLSCQNDQSEETRQVQYFGTTTEKILSCMHTYLRQSQWIGASDQFQSVSRIVEEQKLLVFIFIKQPLLSCNIKGGKNENQLAFVRVVIKMSFVLLGCHLYVSKCEASFFQAFTTSSCEICKRESAVLWVSLVRWWGVIAKMLSWKTGRSNLTSAKYS